MYDPYYSWSGQMATALGRLEDNDCKDEGNVQGKGNKRVNDDGEGGPDKQANKSDKRLRVEEHGTRPEVTEPRDGVRQIGKNGDDDVDDDGDEDDVPDLVDVGSDSDVVVIIDGMSQVKFSLDRKHCKLVKQ